MGIKLKWKIGKGGKEKELKIYVKKGYNALNCIFLGYKLDKQKSGYIIHTFIICLAARG